MKIPILTWEEFADGEGRMTIHEPKHPLDRLRDAEARIAALEAALAALCQVCDGPLDNPAWPGVLTQAKRVLEEGQA